MFVSLRLREGPLEKLWGGGEQSTKNSCNGNLSEKNYTQRVAQKKSSYIRKNIYSYKGSVNKKIRAARKFPPPPTSITFLMVRP